jgi:HEAT repeat protein
MSMEHNRASMGRTGATWIALALTICSAGCLAPGDGSPGVNDTAGRWMEASPILREQIEDEARRLPWTHGFERLEQIRWFAGVGEPAYARLLELAEDERDDVAAAALAALGATLDRRLVPDIRDLDWAPQRTQGDLGLERARTLVRLGDWSSIPVLIAGLRDPRIYTRALCADALREATHENHGFDPQADDAAREAAVQQWESWWKARNGEGLLGGRN